MQWLNNGDNDSLYLSGSSCARDHAKCRRCIISVSLLQLYDTDSFYTYNHMRLLMLWGFISYLLLDNEL